jgi:hypothetical protein
MSASPAPSTVPPGETMAYATPCRCVGEPLRFEPGCCFTCGRFLASEIGALEENTRATGEAAGAMALLEAVHRARGRIRPERPKPKGPVRRVVIEPEAPSRALQTVRSKYALTY